MSNQPEQTITVQEQHQSLEAELEAGKQAIEELRDEDLEMVAGGNLSGGQKTAISASLSIGIPTTITVGLAAGDKIWRRATKAAPVAKIILK